MHINANEKPETTDTGAEKPVRQPRKRRIAREPKSNSESAGELGASTGEESAATKARGQSKIAAVIALLERGQGATLAEMVQATGWLPHTTRAALTGLKKKGHVVTKDKRDNVTCYRVAKAAQ